MNVRRAQPGDVPAIAALLGQLSYPVEPDALARRMERLGADTTLYVAGGGEVLGLAALQVTQGIQSEAPSARIVAFVVDENARRRGVARALLRAVESAAREAGCEHLHVTTAHRRADGHAAYRALGFSDTGVRFGKDLD